MLKSLPRISECSDGKDGRSRQRGVTETAISLLCINPNILIFFFRVLRDIPNTFAVLVKLLKKNSPYDGSFRAVAIVMAKR